jgi:signal transduction histidine kinase
MDPRSAYALIGLSAVVGVIVATMTFAVLRFAAAARTAGRQLGGRNPETAFMAAALEDALKRLKAQERASAARAAASERLSSEIVESLTSGLLVVGLEGEVRILNPAGAKLLGISTSPHLQDYRTLLADAGALSGLIDECLRSKTAIIRRTIRVREGHSPLHVGATTSPLFDEQGEMHGAICLFTDLSAVMELEEQLRIQDSLGRLGELTAGLAHEFRNGLATIHGYGRLIDPAAMPAPYRPYIEGIRQETESLGQIVTNFLNFARPAQLTLTDVDLRALVDRAADDFRADVETRGGAVTVRGDFARIDGDEVMLRQAVSNLLRNSVEACAAAPTPPRIDVQGDIDLAQRLMRLTVRDNGPGIEESIRDKVFRPFFTTKSTGTGLGLALVQKIVVSHNGRISVGAAPGGGAQFQVLLPIAAAR